MNTAGTGNNRRHRLAMAVGESGGNPRARGDGGWSHGPLQIYTDINRRQVPLSMSSKAAAAAQSE